MTNSERTGEMVPSLRLPQTGVEADSRAPSILKTFSGVPDSNEAMPLAISLKCFLGEWVMPQEPAALERVLREPGRVPELVELRLEEKRKQNSHFPWRKCIMELKGS